MPEEWLRYRLAFFYDVTYPSVRAQTTRDFDWLVLFDDRCSAEFRAEIEDLARGTFVPVWDRRPFRRDTFAEPVAALTRGSGRTHLITTRIDSDDAMSRDFMAAVQAEFAGQERLFVNFPHGVQIDRSGAVLRSHTLSSPFLSLIEERVPERPPATVFVAKHARARAWAPIREVRSPVRWAQVVHDGNLSNIVNGVRIDPAVVRQRIELTLPYAEDLSRGSLLRGRATQLRRLGRLWVNHPGEAAKFIEAQAWRLRGTHERAADSGRTWADRLQDVERGASATWAESGIRRGGVRAWRGVQGARWTASAALNARLAAEPAVVAGSVEGVLASRRIVVLAEFDKAPRPRPDALRLAAAWRAAGYTVLVVAARNPLARKLFRAPTCPDGVAIMVRPNLGYDFGSWAAALAAEPRIAEAELVVLANDSVHGPFLPLDELTSRIESSGAQVWAATAGSSPRPHLQSWLLAFTGGVLAQEPLRGFFAGVRQMRSKREVITTYELGLADVVAEAGLRTGVGWDGDAGLNWRIPFSDGMPFVKRSLLTDRGLRDEESAVRLAVRTRYGVDLP